MFPATVFQNGRIAYVPHCHTSGTASFTPSISHLPRQGCARKALGKEGSAKRCSKQRVLASIADAEPSPSTSLAEGRGDDVRSQAVFGKLSSGCKHRSSQTKVQLSSVRCCQTPSRKPLRMRPRRQGKPSKEGNRSAWCEAEPGLACMPAFTCLLVLHRADV